jgi:sortase A
MRRSARYFQGGGGLLLLIVEMSLLLLSLGALGMVTMTTVEGWQFRRLEENRLDSAPDRSEDGETRKQRTSRAIARLEIPRLKLTELIVEGTEGALLDLAPGRIPETDAFGGDGTVGIAGHRDTHFKELRHIAPGDTVRVRTPHGRYTYVVEGTEVVPSTATGVLSSVGYPRLALVTCYPFGYIGPAPKRFVVFARETDG